MVGCVQSCSSVFDMSSLLCGEKSEEDNSTGNLLLGFRLLSFDFRSLLTNVPCIVTSYPILKVSLAVLYPKTYKLWENNIRRISSASSSKQNKGNLNRDIALALTPTLTLTPTLALL